ncbi:hypothetical protein O1C03_003316 [Vibrio cholerae]|nr:hypothetical protein [Vibrio cholerae]
MGLKPPPPEAGKSGLLAFREAVKLHEEAITNRWERQFHRKELARWQKLYATLASKREPGSQAAEHFANLSKLCGELLAEYGQEPPPKKRAPKTFNATPLVYPNFPEEMTHRLHFLEGPGLRRQRATQLAQYSQFVSCQISGTGRTLLSVGVQRTEVIFFERLVEAIGDLLFSDLKKAGFDTSYVMRPKGIPPGTNCTANSLDPNLPIARIWSDNEKAKGYSWQARVLGEQFRCRVGEGLPDDLPHIDNSSPWDPDPAWQRILNLTETDALQEAMGLVEEIPAQQREAMFDEVIYLRFLTGTSVRAEDIRLVARKHVKNSSIAGRLLEDFETYLKYLDEALKDDPPILEQLSRLRPEFGSAMLPPMPPASDWPALRKHLSGFTTPGGPRGRIFSINIDIGFGNVADFFASYMIAAENAFRRDRSIPEIGRGWVSEVALLDLVRKFWPSAVHQWRPGFLGLQSVDIHVPEINLAIEYHGQQHYEPVALFGGEKGFKSTQERDERKKTLLATQSVRLLEWPYTAPITEEELRMRLSELGVSLP